MSMVYFSAMIFFSAVSFAEAQQPKKVPLIGFLRSGSPSTHSSQNEAFVQGLRELGYVEGKNIVIEYRYAEGNRGRWPEIAGERLKVDVIVVGGVGFTRAARQATSIIPIVANAGDLVRGGLVASLENPEEMLRA